MKDLTHYFQSPNKTVNSPDDCVVIEKAPSPDLNSSDRKGHISPCLANSSNDRSNCKSAKADTCMPSDLDERQIIQSPGEVRNGFRHPKTSRKRAFRADGLSDEKQPKSKENIMQSRRKKSKQKTVQNDETDSDEVLNEVTDTGKQHSPGGSDNTLEEKSPNAFQILMSTQQVFSSLNSGKRECSNEVIENVQQNHENKKKIKENLEKMSKRKLEMEATLLSCENSVKKATRKRRRVIVESESEDEVPLEVAASSKTVGRKTRKRNKLDLHATTKEKLKKTDVSALSQKNMDDSTLKAVHYETKRNVDFQESEKMPSRDVKIKRHNKNKSVSSKEDQALINQNNVTFLVTGEKESEVEFQVAPDLSNTKTSNDDDMSVIIDATNTNDITKRKSNILNYFNKISNNGKGNHSEKIKVTADVHFPVVSMVSKTKVRRKKSKRKGVCEKEDDILLIDSEVIEKPSIPTPKRDSSKVISVSEVRDKTGINNEEAAKTSVTVKTDSDLTAPHTTFSHKDWKLRIRMPGDTELIPSPEKCKKRVSPLKKRKLKLTSAKSCSSIFNDGVKQNISDKSLCNTPAKVKNANLRKTANSEEQCTSSSKSLIKRKSMRSSPEKKVSSRDCDNNVNLKGNVENPSAVVKEHVLLNRQSVSPVNESTYEQHPTKVKNSAQPERINATPNSRKSTKLKNSTPQRSNSVVGTETSTPILKTTISGGKIAPLADSELHEQSTPEKVTSLKTKFSSKQKQSPCKKLIGKKKFPVKKSEMKNENSAKKNFIKKESVTPKKNLEKDQSFKEEDETPAPARAKRSCAIKNIADEQVDCISPKKSKSIGKMAFGGNRGAISLRETSLSPKNYLTAKEISNSGERDNRPIHALRISPRKKCFSMPDYGISDDEFDDDDFDGDSDDDFFGDSDDFDSEGCINIDSDYCNDDDPIFMLKKNIKEENMRSVKRDLKKRSDKEVKRKAASIGIILDQEEVLEFLKKAKGTLNRKMALNDPANILCEQPNHSENNSASQKQKQLAPVFVSRKKKKPDRATLIARKTFLQSGVPEVVKKMVEIQKLAEEQEHVMFPSISHVQQREEGALVWNLSDALQEMPCVVEESVFQTSLSILSGEFTKCNSESICSLTYCASHPPKIKLFRNFLRAIKAESPDFPVYRTFRYLSQMNRPQQADNAKKASSKRGKRRSSLTNKKEQEYNARDSEVARAAWTAKYHPLSSNDILGNGYNVSRFKKWLELWVQVKENTLPKNFKDDISSGEEFLNDASDDESGRTILPKKTVILMGPIGCGKTMTVYTVAHELGYKVLEVNASTKRTGRRILSELLEATQSHQVHGKGEEAAPGIKSFFSAKGKSEKGKPSKKENDQQTNKLSLILVEDVDIIFEEEDEGFITALSTLLIGTKRPVVLTTSDPSCPHLSRFLESSLVFKFKPAPSKLISVWLQLISLVEGVRVRKSSVVDLLKYNKGDVRKTLLQLQFWVLSGGENLKLLPESPSESTNTQDFPDDISNSSWVSVDDKKAENDTYHPIHSHCLSPFLELDPQILPIDKGKIWWNMPKLTGLNEVCHEVLKNDCKMSGNKCDKNSSDAVKCVSIAVNEEPERDENEERRKNWKSVCSTEDVTALARLSDVLSAVELLSTTTDCVSSEPYECSWEKTPVNSLSLSEDMRPCEYGIQHTAQSIGSWLVSTSISQSSAQLCPEDHVSSAVILQQQAPQEETSWREQQHNASKELENAVAMLFWPQRRAMTMDYITCLRNISRLEQERVSINDKRNNRFFHYLKGLGAHPSPAVLDTVCNVFNLHKNL